MFQESPSTYRAEALSTIEVKNPALPVYFDTREQAYDIGSAHQIYFSQTLNQQLMISRSKVHMEFILVEDVAAAVATAGHNSKASNGSSTRSNSQFWGMIRWAVEVAIST